MKQCERSLRYGVESLLEDLDRSSKAVEQHVATSDEIARTAFERSAARRIQGADLRAQLSTQMWIDLIALNARARR